MLVLGLSGVVALGLAGGAAAASPGSVSISLKPDTAGRGSTLSVSAQGPFPSETGMPTGAAIDVQRGFVASVKSVAALCGAAQAAQRACPGKSHIGDGSAQVTGTYLGFSQTVNVVLTLYLGKPQTKGDLASVVIVGQAMGQTASATGRLRSLPAGPYGLELRFDKLPAFSLPPGTTATLDQLQLSAGATRTVTVRRGRGRHKRRHRYHYSLITNPRQCAGSWSGQLTIDFQSGPQLTRALAAPCRAA